MAVIRRGDFRVAMKKTSRRKKKKPYPKGKHKIEKVMGEFKRGTLRSSSGRKVTKKSQAVAIAISEQRRAEKRRRKRKRRKK